MMEIKCRLARPRLQNRRRNARQCDKLALYRAATTAIVFILGFNLIKIECLEVTSSNNESASNKHQERRLSCEPGEQRHFNYESATKLWGSSNQQLRIRASLRLRCMEAPTSTTLKYLAEVLSVEPHFESDGNLKGTEGRSLSGFNKLTTGTEKLPRGQRFESQVARAEPVFEEVAEAATRVKRSVSGWFNKTWSSVKDFFSNIFQSSERSSVGRDEILQDHGIDIAGQCKAGKTNGKRPNGLPLDESVFDDLEPKYYIGASSVEALATSYDFFADLDGEDEGHDDDEQLSFFDDPKPRSARKRRAVGDTGAKQKDHEHLLKMPFVIVQSRSGRIVEVRFSLEETDVGVKNFKRHLSDLFATNLDNNKSQLNEVTPIGQHPTKYLLDSSPNATIIKQTLAADGGSKQEGGHSNNQQVVVQDNELLVKALAVQATALASTQMADFADLNADHHKVESREPTGNLDNQRLSVLRTINSTSQIQLGTRTAGADIERMQVQVKQVQQIFEGRLTGNAGQLSMSLIQSRRSGSSARPKRSAGQEEEPLGDMADLLQVFTSFTMQLVPLSKLGQFDLKKRQRRSQETARSVNQTQEKQPVAVKRETLVERPRDSEELQKTLMSWRQLETKLQFVTSDLLPEQVGANEGQLERLDILRNQVQLRLNEEFLRNNLRRLRRRGQQLAIMAPESGPRSVGGAAEPTKSGKLADSSAVKTTGALGLGLTQLVLDSGSTGRRKGSVYPTIEEAIELEQSLGVAHSEEAISRLLKETVRVERLQSHCKSTLLVESENLHEVEFREPFGLPAQSGQLRLVDDKANERKLTQCKQVVGLLVRLGDRRAADLLLDLIDECNAKLVATARHEELGYGPTGRHYRRLRQQFTELMAELAKPSELLLDRLLSRLHYMAAKPASRQPPARDDQQEFAYVPAVGAATGAGYNRSLLREVDDYNNNDGAGSLLMTITRLASQPSISERKRAELAARLLLLLKTTTCSLFDGPDLDILESVGSLQLEQDQLLAKQVVGLARRCRHQDQYLVACVHALQGQLASSELSQRFLAEQLRSKNVSCTVKSEIVLTLLNSILLAELGRSAGKSSWPGSGLNQVDEALLELAKGEPSDRRCLGQLVDYYLSKKRSLEPLKPQSRPPATRTGGAKRSGRGRRAAKELDFWDEANCKRWSIEQADQAVTNGSSASPVDPLEDIDDNSILTSLANHKPRAKSLQLNERELEATNTTNLAPPATASLIRRRHKCTASKTYGPQNAQATLKAEIVNDLVGARDENKFLARFRLATNFLGHQIDVGRMYLWHQKRTTRAHVNILGKSLWDTSHSCHDRAPHQMLYMPLFDFSLWLVKVSVGLRLHSEMGFFSNCNQQLAGESGGRSQRLMDESATGQHQDELELYPTVQLRAAGEASAKFVVARVGMSLASHYGYQGNIRVSKQPESCMSIRSAHQPMNITFSSWFQLWDNDCHYWGSRNKAEPQATKWRLAARQPSVWLKDECLISSSPSSQLSSSQQQANSSSLH